MPSESDLDMLIYARNSSIHDGLASASEIDQVKAVINLGRAYLAVIRRVARR